MISFIKLKQQKKTIHLSKVEILGIIIVLIKLIMQRAFSWWNQNLSRAISPQGFFWQHIIYI